MKSLVNNKRSVTRDAHKMIWKPKVLKNWKDKSTHRDYFNTYAASKDFDPLVPENWYTIADPELSKASFLSTYYRDSLAIALMEVYPNIGLKRTKFPVMPRNYWSSMENKRAFLEECAAAMKIDPLIPESWYPVEAKTFFRNFPKVWTLSKQYGSSLARTLMNVFPFIGLEEHKFKELPHNHYKAKENRRRVFDSFATQHQFDALVPENWYSIPKSMIINFKGGSGTMCYYKSMAHAIRDLYPDIGAKDHLFRAQRRL